MPNRHVGSTYVLEVPTECVKIIVINNQRSILCILKLLLATIQPKILQKDLIDTVKVTGINHYPMSLNNSF